MALLSAANAINKKQHASDRESLFLPLSHNAKNSLPETLYPANGSFVSCLLPVAKFWIPPAEMPI